jgi:hypothetical protein
MNLFTNTHQVNYDEAIARMKYWLEQVERGTGRGLSELNMLCALLTRNRDNLYFEEKR